VAQRYVEEIGFFSERMICGQLKGRYGSLLYQETNMYIMEIRDLNSKVRHVESILSDAEEPPRPKLGQMRDVFSADALQIFAEPIR
jgi:hypothetical protein